MLLCCGQKQAQFFLGMALFGRAARLDANDPKQGE
jgi:hypothetical protein